MGFPKLSNSQAGYSEARAVPQKRIAIDIPAAVDISGLSRAQLYKDLRAKRLAAYKNGSRTLIFVDDLEKFLRGLPAAQFKPLAIEQDEAAAPEAVESNNSDHSGLATPPAPACMTIEAISQYRRPLEEQK